MPLPQPGRATLAAVQDSLRNHDYAIGTVASYERFHRELWDLLDGLRALRINRGRDDYAADYLGDEALVARVSELNREDQKLVQWVEAEHRGLWLRRGDARQQRWHCAGCRCNRAGAGPGNGAGRMPLSSGSQRAPQSLMWP